MVKTLYYHVKHNYRNVILCVCGAVLESYDGLFLLLYPSLFLFIYIFCLDTSRLWWWYVPPWLSFILSFCAICFVVYHLKFKKLRQYSSSCGSLVKKKETKGGVLLCVIKSIVYSQKCVFQWFVKWSFVS